MSKSHPRTVDCPVLVPWRCPVPSPSQPVRTLQQSRGCGRRRGTSGSFEGALKVHRTTHPHCWGFPSLWCLLTLPVPHQGSEAQILSFPIFHFIVFFFAFPGSAVPGSLRSWPQEGTYFTTDTTPFSHRVVSVVSPRPLASPPACHFSRSTLLPLLRRVSVVSILI